MSVSGTLVEAEMYTFTLESKHFIFNKSPIYTHDGASAKFSTNSQEMYYSEENKMQLKFLAWSTGKYHSAYSLYALNELNLSLTQ